MKTKRRSLPTAIRRYVQARAAGKCEQCGSPEKLSFNHITPIAFGGPDTLDNLELVCGPCHKLRHAEAVTKHGRNLGGPISKPPEELKRYSRSYKMYWADLDDLAELAQLWRTTEAETLRRLIRDGVKRERRRGAE